MRYGEFVPALLLVLVAYRRNSTNPSLERQTRPLFHGHEILDG
jgi:hypothetical protein